MGRKRLGTPLPLEIQNAKLVIYRLESGELLVNLLGLCRLTKQYANYWRYFFRGLRALGLAKSLDEVPELTEMVGRWRRATVGDYIVVPATIDFEGYLEQFTTIEPLDGNPFDVINDVGAAAESLAGFTKEEKLKTAMALRSLGWKDAEIAPRLGVCVKTLYNWGFHDDIPNLVK